MSVPFADPRHRQQPFRQACAELERRLRAGEPCRAEDFFAAQPDLAEAPDAALELIYTEFLAREHLGQRPTPEEFHARFPHLSDDLGQLFAVHRLGFDTHASSTDTLLDP